MRKLLILPVLTLFALGMFAAPTYAWRCRANVVAVKQVKVVEQVKVQQVVAVEKVRVAAVVAPVVQVTEVRAAVAYPYYSAPLVYGSPADTGRLDRLERAQLETSQAVKTLAETQQQLIQRLTAPR